jgi:PilZ domain
MSAALKLPTPEHYANRRQSRRRDVSIPAKIGYRHQPPIACTVRNISPMGALLEFSDNIVLPETFRIVIESKMFWADCEVRHRKGNAAGVMFTSNRMEALAAFG